MTRRSYVTKRILQAAFVIYAVITLSFALIRLMPGGPLDYMRGELMEQATKQQSSVNMAEINRLTETYVNINPDEPILVQYVDYVTAVLSGDLGRSFVANEPVATVLIGALPWTVFLFFLAIMTQFLFGVLLGALMASIEGTRFDSIMTVTITTLHAVPFYVVAIILLYYLAFVWNVLPSGGRFNPDTTPGFNYAFLKGVFEHALLPYLSLLIAGFGGPALEMRANSISVLGRNYVRIAQIRGLLPRRIVFEYVARNAVLPLYTSFLIALGGMFGGSVILEQIFSYRGVGYYLFQSISARDYPLMMGAFMLITVMIIAGTVIADLSYAYVDPRASTEADREVY